MNALSRALELVVVVAIAAVALHLTCVPGAEGLERAIGRMAWALVCVFEGL